MKKKISFLVVAVAIIGYSFGQTENTTQDNRALIQAKIWYFSHLSSIDYASLLYASTYGKAYNYPGFAKKEFCTISSNFCRDTFNFDFEEEKIEHSYSQLIDEVIDNGTQNSMATKKYQLFRMNRNPLIYQPRKSADLSGVADLFIQLASGVAN